MARNQHDHFYRMAKKEGYRSRASYKLKQINTRFHIIRRGDAVVDLGAAPGGWTQVAAELAGNHGRVVGVDLQSISSIDGATTIVGDIRSEATLDAIRQVARSADVVLSDAAPNLAGDWSYDHARSVDLAEHALGCAQKILRPGGNFVVKVFQGDLFPGYLQNVRVLFRNAYSHSPMASRKASAEMYIVAKMFRGDKGATSTRDPTNVRNASNVPGVPRSLKSTRGDRGGRGRGRGGGDRKDPGDSI
ncbi:MAG: RlmE family RNA methyltransferase [Methanosarcinales archaeon]|nr:MAG: RlmE family RNA methyltransferase [Methanosarcinales archaeon]